MKYKVSVVTPVYNVEKYLEECIDSVINQTIGFKDNIQLILINDGSPDKSYEVCERYKKLYPDNIVYIDKKNTGVSNSRNIGIDEAQGEYVSFLDSDDKLSHEYYENVCDLLDDNAEVPFAVGRMRFFDALDKFHPTDYRFKTTKVVDLLDSPNTPQSAIAPLVCRRSQLGKVRFDESMTHLEDAKFIDELLLESGIYKYGVVRESIYYYRKRQDQSSASDTALRREEYYRSLGGYFKFLTTSIRLQSERIAFLEFNALYRVGWSIDQPQKPSVLSNDSWSEYKKSLRDLICEISDETIVEGGTSVNLRRKTILLRVKYNNKKIRLEKSLTKKIINEQSVYITNINHRGVSGITVEGEVRLADPNLLGLVLDITVGGVKIKQVISNRYISFLDEEIPAKIGFSFNIDKDWRGDVKFTLKGEDFISENLPITYGHTSRVGMRRNDYRVLKSDTLILPFSGGFRVESFRLRKIFVREMKLFAQNILVNKHRIKRNVIKSICLEMLRCFVLLRLRYLKPSKVWLFSDRTISGGDNSEVLFRYVSDNAGTDATPYYVINKNTSTYSRLKSAGYRVIPYRSIRHLYISIIAEFMLTSHLDEIYFYPWHALRRKYFGLSQFDIIHTQHGIALNDMSSYVGKFSKDATLFLSACEWEKKGLLADKYGYEDWQLPVTGLPRYDELEDTSGDMTTRVISIHPTWRPWASGKNVDGKRLRNPHFNMTDYYRFYQDLINDPKLIKAAERANCKIKFYIHPNHAENAGDFTCSSDTVEIMRFPYNYNRMFSESSLFITDYSNTLFDFAYLRKPIILTQFDRDEFFSRHGAMTSGRTFDYEKDGLGSVAMSYADAVASIIASIDNNFSLSNKYNQRIDKFFDYDDRLNSKRAYDYIIRYAQDMRENLK